MAGLSYITERGLRNRYDKYIELLDANGNVKLTGRLLDNPISGRFYLSHAKSKPWKYILQNGDKIKIAVSNSKSDSGFSFRRYRVKINV